MARSKQLQQEQIDDGSDTRSCTSNSTSSTAKSVQFCERRSALEEIHRISRLSNYTEDELRGLWTTEDERLLRKQELRDALQECKYNTRRESDDQFSRLGLHDKFGEGRRCKEKYRKNAAQAVLDEQELQREEGTEDKEMLADVYYMSNHQSQQRAQDQASKLQAEIRGTSFDAASTAS